MMKKFFFSVMLVVFCYAAMAVDFKLSWCSSSDASVIGYRVYYTLTNKISNWTPTVYANGTNCPGGAIVSVGSNWLRNYTITNDVGNVTSYTLNNVVVGKTYYITVAAYDTNGIVSVYSNEMERSATNFPPSAPTNLQIIDIK